LRREIFANPLWLGGWRSIAIALLSQNHQNETILPFLAHLDGLREEGLLLATANNASQAITGNFPADEPFWDPAKGRLKDRLACW
jgi:hypothetical protein